MKYNDKYPDAEYLDMVDQTIMKSTIKDNCYNCGELTNFIDIDFECHVCSEECEDEILDQFFRHVMVKDYLNDLF